MVRALGRCGADLNPATSTFKMLLYFLNKYLNILLGSRVSQLLYTCYPLPNEGFNYKHHVSYKLPGTYRLPEHNLGAGPGGVQRIHVIITTPGILVAERYLTKDGSRIWSLLH